jgi:hypothetical protein
MSVGRPLRADGWGLVFSPVSVGFAPTRPFWGAPIRISGACGPASLYQQHFVVNDPNGQAVCAAGAANTVNFF